MDAVGLMASPLSPHLTAAAAAHKTELSAHACRSHGEAGAPPSANLWETSVPLLPASAPAHLLRCLKIPGCWVPSVLIMTQALLPLRNSDFLWVKPKLSKILAVCTQQSAFVRAVHLILGATSHDVSVEFQFLPSDKTMPCQHVSLVTLTHMITDVKQGREKKDTRMKLLWFF